MTVSRLWWACLASQKNQEIIESFLMWQHWHPGDVSMCYFPGLFLPGTFDCRELMNPWCFKIIIFFNVLLSKHRASLNHCFISKLENLNASEWLSNLITQSANNPVWGDRGSLWDGNFIIIHHELNVSLTRMRLLTRAAKANRIASASPHVLPIRAPCKQDMHISKAELY